MNFLKLQKEKLNLEEINELVVHESCGAVSLFIGTTRDNFEDKKVLCLEYEAYETMALKAMQEICDNLRNKWSDLKHIVIYHRLGIVPVKEASVVIAISSPHRQSSLESVQYAINELKKTVPIWKKEKYENNTSEWKANKESNLENINRSKFDLNKCLVEKTFIPKNFIQIQADDNELKRRIQCFIDMKRKEIDYHNILEFIENPNQLEETSETCARVRTVIFKRDDSKGHIRVHRVKNEIGPQIGSGYTRALDKLTTSPQKQKQFPDKTLPIGISERVENTEKYLGISHSVPKTVYERLKMIEDKIRFLETISPEYRHFIDPKNTAEINQDYNQKKAYTIDDLDNYIQFFEKQKS